MIVDEEILQEIRDRAELDARWERSRGLAPYLWEHIEQHARTLRTALERLPISDARKAGLVPLWEALEALDLDGAS